MFFMTYYKLFHTSHSSCSSIEFVEQKAMWSAVLNCLIFVIEFPFSITVVQDPDDSYLLDQKVLSRKKRYLNFPDGSILQVSTNNKERCTLQL
jgi:hypothetical protein